MSGDYSNLLAISKQKNGEARYLRYCPLCAKEDRNVYGETYWHRAHQMMGVNFCPKHGCSLMNSSIMINAKASPNLTTAEFEIKEIGNITYGNELEIKLVQYIWEVFQADMAMENDVEAGKFLHSRLYGTKYVSVRGEQRNIRLFAEDFLAFYESLSGEGLSELWQMQKIFNGYRFNCFEVCQMAMFQGISIEDLCNMKLPDKSQEQIFRGILNRPVVTVEVKRAKDADKYLMEWSVGFEGMELKQEGFSVEEELHSLEEVENVAMWLTHENIQEMDWKQAVDKLHKIAKKQSK